MSLAGINRMPVRWVNPSITPWERVLHVMERVLFGLVCWVLLLVVLLLQYSLSDALQARMLCLLPLDCVPCIALASLGTTALQRLAT